MRTRRIRTAYRRRPAQSRRVTRGVSQGEVASSNACGDAYDDDFNAATKVYHTSLLPEVLHNALEVRLVHIWKGPSVKSRVCARGYNPQVHDVDIVFASTPSVSARKLMLTDALAYNWSTHAYDITTTFLHAPLPEPLYAWAPT